MKAILFIFGTRPEAIKLAPLIRKYSQHSKSPKVLICVTAQHRQMLDQILSFFSIEPDFDLDLMRKNQSLSELTAAVISGVDRVIRETKPDLMFVQGDTTSALASSLVGYYNDVQVAHVEAGLRSYNRYAPFPEETNRILISQMASYHFAPTKNAQKNLVNEGITNHVWIVGNTVIDALLFSLRVIKSRETDFTFDVDCNIDFNKKIILITGHRRESFGKTFENICGALKDLAQMNPQVEFVYPVHLNPNVRNPVWRILSRTKNIHLLDPLNYPQMIWLMNKSYFVITDSGGIQEEAPSLGKPVLVTRDVTERTEGIEAGTAKLVGTERVKIIQEATLLLNNEKYYNLMSKSENPYGDGRASERIYEILCNTNTNFLRPANLNSFYSEGNLHQLSDID